MEQQLFVELPAGVGPPSILVLSSVSSVPSDGPEFGSLRMNDRENKSRKNNP